MAPDEKDKDHGARSFEEEMAALEKAVEELEGGGLTLEEAIRSFESGFQSMKKCYRILQDAERRIEALCADATEGSGEDGDVATPQSGGRDRPTGFHWQPLDLKRIPQLDEERNRGSTKAGEGGPSNDSGTRKSGKGRGDDESRPISYADDFAPGES